MQIHHVVYFDTATETWHVDEESDAYFQEGEIWEPNKEEWRMPSDSELDAIIDQAGMLEKYLNENPFLEVPTA